MLGSCCCAVMILFVALVNNSDMGNTDDRFSLYYSPCRGPKVEYYVEERSTFNVRWFRVAVFCIYLGVPGERQNLFDTERVFEMTDFVFWTDDR